eukprot:14530906-Alexandrium_andersonii.AAC.1
MVVILETRDRQGGQSHWGFPKGHPQGDESGPVAAVREIREETGVEVGTLCTSVYRDAGWSYLHE